MDLDTFTNTADQVAIRLAAQYKVPRTSIPEALDMAQDLLVHGQGLLLTMPERRRPQGENPSAADQKFAPADVLMHFATKYFEWTTRNLLGLGVTEELGKYVLKQYEDFLHLLLQARTDALPDEPEQRNLGMTLRLIFAQPGEIWAPKAQ
jgi:hypothetical protein